MISSLGRFLCLLLPNILLSLIGLVLVLFSIELSIRVINLPWKTASDELRNFRYDPPLPTHRGYGVMFREWPIDPVKPAGAYRIVVLGDSYSWGDKIRNSKDTWPRVLEASLNAQGLDRKIEVINLGACGFTTVNQAELLARVGRVLRPDLLIVQFCINDPLPSGPKFFNQGEGHLFPTVNLMPMNRLHSWLDRNSYLYGYLNQKFRIVQIKLSGRSYSLLYEEDYPGFKDCKQALSDIASIARSMQVRTLYAFFPTFSEGRYTRETYPYTAIVEKMQLIAEENGMIPVDLLDAFLAEGRPLQAWKALRLDGHPGVEACQLAATAIGRVILDRKKELGL